MHTLDNEKCDRELVFPCITPH